MLFRNRLTVRSRAIVCSWNSSAIPNAGTNFVSIEWRAKAELSSIFTGPGRTAIEHRPLTPVAIDWARCQDVSYLCGCFDHVGAARLADGGDGGLRRCAELYEEAGGDRAGAAEAGAAVDDDQSARAQGFARFAADVLPRSLEIGAGNASVGDRQVPPREAAARERRFEIGDAEDFEFVRLVERDQEGRIEAADRFEVEREVTTPMVVVEVVAAAGEKRHVDAAGGSGDGDFVDDQWVGEAGLELDHVGGTPSLRCALHRLGGRFDGGEDFLEDRFDEGAGGEAVEPGLREGGEAVAGADDGAVD